jgi:hypothetical protein
MPTTVKRANTTLVAIAWLGGVEGLTPSMVASSLPADNSSWAASGFVTVRPTGGTSSVDNPVRRPVVTVDTYAVNPLSDSRAPMGQANNLAELVVNACWQRTRAERLAVQRLLTLPHGHPAARVLAAIVRTEPRPAYGELGRYAHFVTDVELDWIEVPA